MNDLILSTINNEPRVLDTDLAERLGFSAPRQIREIIRRNLSELEGYGGVVTYDALVWGNPVSQFYLNEEQALLICMFSRTENAKQVRAMLIRVFQAYRKGQLTEAPPALPQTYAEALRALADEAERTERLAVENKAMKVVFSEHDHTLGRFARTLDGVNTQKVKKSLLDLGYLYQMRGVYRVYAQYKHLFVERMVEAYGSIDIIPTEDGKVLLTKLHAERKLARVKGR